MSCGLAVSVLAALSAAPALAGGSVCPSWNVTSGNWSVAGNWFLNLPPTASTNACLVNGTSGTPATTTLDASQSIQSLTVGASNTLNFNNGTQLSVAGPTIGNAGAINLNGSGSGTYLNLNGGNVTLSGGGTVTLAGGGNTLIYNSTNNHQILENVDNKILGVGNIGDGGGGYNMSLTNDASGIVNANVNGGTLQLVLGGGVTNAGTLEATNGGQLQIYNAVNNAGGAISTDSNVNSKVLLEGGSTIQGGTLNGNVQTAGNTTLDGSTQGTLNNSATFTVNNGNQATVLGTINNTGTILLAGTGSGTYISVGGGWGSTTLLQGAARCQCRAAATH
jgi:hypothetical protein